MFEVRRKTDHNQIRTVYSIKDDPIFKILFLIFHEGEWFWSRAELWEPVDTVKNTQPMDENRPIIKNLEANSINGIPQFLIVRADVRNDVIKKYLRDDKQVCICEQPFYIGKIAENYSSIISIQSYTHEEVENLFKLFAK